jgi:hypothetical protein
LNSSVPLAVKMLNANEIEEFAEELQSFHRPMKRIYDPFDNEWG